MTLLQYVTVNTSPQLAQIHRCWINIYAHYKNPAFYAVLYWAQRQRYAQEEMKHFVKLRYTTFGQKSAFLTRGTTSGEMICCFQTQEAHSQLEILPTRSWRTVAACQNVTAVNSVLWFELTIQRCGSHLPHLPIGILTHVVFDVT